MKAYLRTTTKKHLNSGPTGDGPSAYGFLLVDQKKLIESGAVYCGVVSSYRVELLGLIDVLKRTTGPITLILANRSLVLWLTKSLKRWAATDFRTRDGAQIRHVDLWVEIAGLLEAREVAFVLNNKNSGSAFWNEAKNLATVEIAKFLKRPIGIAEIAQPKKTTKKKKLKPLTKEELRSLSTQVDESKIQKLGPQDNYQQNMYSRFKYKDLG